MSVQPIRPLHRIRAALDERIAAVMELADYLELPVTLTPSVRDDAVHVVVIDAAQLAMWVFQLGGEMNRAPQLDGASLWTLRTCTPDRGDGSTVEIRVHAAVVCDELVVAEFRPAVTA
ncbi:hypothetical protein [Streptomyces sp. NBC_01373]|uniref:hypothetical protein n=1 Tax=Streptomyces sp. NBC_01373 TaxID=2903843 RepID=UPI00225192D6|nr:hypothetical protein [Streptomyces sp. NBC_01373]MCX4705694.1 hypothetical protein [Streptomyces sp. NBC_01373]